MFYRKFSQSPEIGRCWQMDVKLNIFLQIPTATEMNLIAMKKLN